MKQILMTLMASLSKDALKELAETVLVRIGRREVQDWMKRNYAQELRAGNAEKIATLHQNAADAIRAFAAAPETAGALGETALAAATATAGLIEEFVVD